MRPRHEGVAHVSPPQPPAGDPRAQTPAPEVRVPDFGVVERASARARIGSWLLSGEPQPSMAGDADTKAPVAGGVAGMVGGDGSADYLYPEITGYFLQWLASSVTPANRLQLSEHAALAQNWLRAWIDIKPMPPTRMYLRGARNDWRNQAIFCFDHAMVLRGLASAARRGLIALDATLVSSVCAQIETLIAPDGILDACRVQGDLAALPQRWSTRRGGFLAKAAAGILQAVDVAPIPARLAASARMSHAASLLAAVKEPQGQSHPFLYAFEGLLARFDSDESRAALPAMLKQLDELISGHAATGQMQEGRDEPGRPRLDIVAQTVRVICALESAEASSSHRLPRVDGMLDNLARAVRDDGSMPFAADDPEGEANTWTAMFTEQAFAYAENGARSSLGSDSCLV